MLSPQEAPAKPENYRVSLQKLITYNRAETQSALVQLLLPLGGMQAFVKPGQKVLIKPNLLAGKTPDKAVTTHPEIVRAVIKLAQECGGEVSLGDSPGIGSPENVARKSGILDVVEETGIRFAPFEKSVKIRPSGGTFHELKLPRIFLMQMLLSTCQN